MEIELITRSDLENFKNEILQEIRQLLKKNDGNPKKNWLKSKDLQEMLGISPGTLQTLRNQGKVPFTKLGGVIYYPFEELKSILSHSTEKLGRF